MRTIILLAILAITACAPRVHTQNPNTAKYPNTAPADADLLVAKNFASTTLSSSLPLGATSIPVVDGTVFAVPGVVTIESEVICVSAKTASTLTVCSGGRGFDGTTAAGHDVGKAVTGNVVAWHHNQLAAEIMSIASDILSNGRPGTKLPLAGGIMTGVLTLSGNPTANLHAVPKQWVDATFVPIAGAVTMTGPLILSQDPTQALGAATKQYVDNFSGLTVFPPLTKSGSEIKFGTLTSVSGARVFGSTFAGVVEQKSAGSGITIADGSIAVNSSVVPVAGASVPASCFPISAGGSTWTTTCVSGSGAIVGADNPSLSGNVSIGGLPTLRYTYTAFPTGVGIFEGGLVYFDSNGNISGVPVTGQFAFGICVAGCSFPGSGPTIAVGGISKCYFDAVPTTDRYVQISTTAAGKCRDAGAALPSSGQVIGITGGGCVGGGAPAEMCYVRLFGPEIEQSTATATANGIPRANGSNKLAAGWISEVLAVSDLSDFAAKSGSGTTAIGTTMASLATNDVLKWDGGNWVNTNAPTLSSLTLGAAGTALTQVRVYSQSLDVASVSANSTAEQTFTVTGLTTADKCFVNKPSHSVGLIVYNCRVSAADTLALQFANITGTAIDPTAETYAVWTARN